MQKDIIESYSEEELKALCFELNIVYDSLPGSGTASKTLELIHYFAQAHIIDQLLEKLREDRPHVRWIFDEAEAVEIAKQIERRDRPNVNIKTIRAAQDATVVVGSNNTTTINRGLGKGALAAMTIILGILVLGSASAVVRFLSANPTALPLPTATAFSLPTPVPTPTRPTRMDGEFRIAIAQFGELEPNGLVVTSEQGSVLSGWFFDRLNMISNTVSVQPQIWHDKLNIGSVIGVIEGDSDEKRAAQAEARARSLNANLIIYGNLVANQTARVVSFAPDFLVAGPWDDRDITGRYQLGMPITATRVYSGDEDILRLINDRLTPRANAVTLLANGLFYELNNEPLKAAKYYSDATQLKDWDNSSGKELAWHFLGRAYAASNQELEAIRAFTMALALNPHFGRPLIGLGNIYYRRAQILSPSTRRLETDDLKQAIDYYDEALALSPETQSEVLSTRAKALLSLARCHMLTAEALIARAFERTQRGQADEALQDYEDADQALQQTLQLSEQSRSIVSKDAPELGADLEFVQGAAYQEQAHIRIATGYASEGQALFVKAKQAYTACLQLDRGNAPPPRVADIAQQGCLPQSNDVEQRLNELQNPSDPVIHPTKPTPTPDAIHSD